MNREEAQKAVEKIISSIYPESIQRMIMEAYIKNPGAGDASYWEAIQRNFENPLARISPQSKKENKEESL